MYPILFWGVPGVIAAGLLRALALAARGQWRGFRLCYASAWLLVAGAWIFAIAVPAGSHASASGDFALRMFLVSFVGALAAVAVGILVLALWAWRERRP